MKTPLQGKIDAGEIGSMAQLLAYVSDCGWTITRNGAGYLGLQDAFGKRFRVKFSFLNDTRPNRLRVPSSESKSGELLAGYWIYGLFAHSDHGRACYIGQAVDYLRRAKDHVRGREGRSSWDLAQWAEKRQVIIRFALLDFIPGQPRTHAVASEASAREGLWLHRAQGAGYLTPGSERWGGLPKPSDNEYFSWPADQIAQLSRPLTAVYAEQLAPTEISILSLREEYLRLSEQEAS